MTIFSLAETLSQLNHFSTRDLLMGKGAVMRKVASLLVGILCKVFVPLHADTQETQWKKHMDAADEAYRQGHYGDAEKSIKAALKEAERFGPQDLRLGTTLNNLASLYEAQGKYAEAEPLDKRALAIEEKALGPEDPYVAIIGLNNLAELYHQQGKYAEAEPLHKRSLSILEKALGPEHPIMAKSLNNLGLVYTAQGKYAEAEPLYKRSLAIREKTLGPEHPSVASALENYAVLLRKTNREAEAAKLEARAKAIRAMHPQKNPAK